MQNFHFLKKASLSDINRFNHFLPTKMLLPSNTLFIMVSMVFGRVKTSGACGTIRETLVNLWCNSGTSEIKQNDLFIFCFLVSLRTDVHLYTHPDTVRKCMYVFSTSNTQICHK